MSAQQKMIRVVVLLTWVLAALSHQALAFPLNAGDVLISNHTGNSVQRLEPSTGTVTTLVSIAGTPIGLAFDTAFNLYINTGDSILKLDKSTDVVTTLFTGVGQREGLTFDPVTNHLFSVSFGGNHIEEVDLSGNLVRTVTIPGTAALLGISARGGQLAVTDFGTGKVFLGTTTGSTFNLIGTLSPGNTYAPDIDAAGNIYVNVFDQGKTVKFTSGTFILSDFITGLSEPDNGLSIGDDGSFTISEFGANAVSIWNSDGTLRSRFPEVQSPDELVVFAPSRLSGNKCPLTQGFWKTHPDAWPVTSLTLGSQTYSQTELLTILGTSSGGDASPILAKQLIAAKLNIAHASNPTPVSATIADADSLLGGFSGKLPYGVPPSSTIGQAMVNDATVLDHYSNGELTPDCQP